VLIPLGAPDHFVRSFEPVIAKAREKGAGVIGMKALGGGHAVNKGVSIESLLHYHWNLPIDTGIIGTRNKDEVKAALAAAHAWKPLDEKRVGEILAQAKPLGTTDVLWWKRA
jgi:hypothetical protein